MAFCIGTTYYFAVQRETLGVLEQAVQKCWEYVGSLAMTAEGATEFFTGPVDKSEALQQAGVEIGLAVDSWKAYANSFAARKAAGQSLQRDESSARMVCAMLHRAESADALTEDDARRLMPLARWIEETSAVIASSVEQLVR